MEGGDLVRSTTELLGRFPADLELELDLMPVVFFLGSGAVVVET